MGERDLDVEHLARYLATSERTLRRRVKNICGTTPAQFIRPRRLERARTMLRNETYGTVAEVSLAVGLAHAGHFARLYKDAFGSTPSEEAQRADASPSASVDEEGLDHA